MTSNGYGVAVLPGESWALIPRSLEIRTSGFWETGGQILRLGFEIKNFPQLLAPRARRPRSLTTAYACNAARSAAPTNAWVGRTQAVGHRVMPLVRINSATASPLSSAIIHSP